MQMNLVHPLEDMEIEQCNNWLERQNKQVNRHKHENKKAVEEKEKLAREAVALNAKIQELETGKETGAKTSKETIFQLTTQKYALEVNLNIALTKSQKIFMKGSQWQASATRRGHYIVDLHRKLDASFLLSKNLFFNPCGRSMASISSGFRSILQITRKKEITEKEILAKRAAFEANHQVAELTTAFKKPTS